MTHPTVTTESRTVASHHSMQTPVLVLNASYEPINICGARRALVLVLKGVAKAEEEHDAILHAARVLMPLPSVIRLLEYRRIPHQTRALSRKNILLRDRNTCQYCGVVLTAGELTLDHVIPRSRGGLSTWENLVACCHRCNRRKGNRLPREIQMHPRKNPRPPGPNDLDFGLALAARLRDQLLGVFLAEVRRQEHGATQMQAPGCDRHGDSRIPPCRSRRPRPSHRR